MLQGTKQKPTMLVIGTPKLIKEGMRDLKALHVLGIDIKVTDFIERGMNNKDGIAVCVNL